MSESNVNPLAGNDATSVEAAALKFTERFEGKTEDERDENQPPVGRAKQAPDTEAEDDEGNAPNDDFSDDLFQDDNAGGEDGDEDADDTEGDDDEEDAGEDDDAEDDEEDEDNREYDIQVDGKTEKVKLSELRTGYMRDADYRQKTTRLSEEREEVTAYAREAVAERQQLVERLQFFEDAVTALMPTDDDWKAVREQNPQLYIQSRDQWEAINAKIVEARRARAETAENEEKEARRQRKEFVASEDRKLIEKMPALANPEKREKFSRTILEYAERIGYTKEEIIAGAVDHRDVITLYNAAKYDEYRRGRKTGQRPAQSQIGKPSPSSKPRSISSGANKGRKLTDARKKAARSGSMNDAAMSFTRMLDE